MYLISEHESLQTHCCALFELFILFHTHFSGSLSQRQLCVYKVFDSEAAEKTKLDYF